uniref:Uncharacterized LOC101242983 n=1 Tax=Ciona intestinalis TaxID=7719 RepID=F6ZPB6_CIOIN
MNKSALLLLLLIGLVVLTENSDAKLKTWPKNYWRKVWSKKNWRKFVKKFKHWNQGQNVEDMDLEDMQLLWEI